jgi:ribulose-5-phosphate 4-epimerase/fuculose-1-phosphate aldolase
MSLESDLEEAASLARAAALPLWSPASGGNVSVKDEAADTLVVKASGMRLGELTPRRGLACLRLSGVRALLDDASYDALSFFDQQDRAGRAQAACLLPGPRERPSLETGFHSLGDRVVLHTHPIPLAAALSMREGRELAMDLAQGLGGGVVWVDLRPPGYSLARLIRQELGKRPGASLALLQNHGLVAWGPDAATVLGLTRSLAERCQTAFGLPEPPRLHPEAALLDAVRKGLERLLKQELGAANALSALATDPYAAGLAFDEEWAWQPVLADDALFCGMQVPLLSPSQALDPIGLAARFQGAARRVAVAVRGQGVAAAAETPRALETLLEMLRANALTRAMTRRRGKTLALSAEVCASVAGMEGERYRQRLADQAKA